MAARAKKTRETARPDSVRRISEPIAFLAEQPRSFAYVEGEDEFEIPQIPTAFARSGRELRFSVEIRPASSFDRLAVN